MTGQRGADEQHRGNRPCDEKGSTAQCSRRAFIKASAVAGVLSAAGGTAASRSAHGAGDRPEESADHFNARSEPLTQLLHERRTRIDELHRVQPGRTALLVVDMQRGFLESGAALEVPPGREIVPNLQRLIEACRRQDMPVIFTKYVYESAVPCLRGDPFGPEHLPARPDEPIGAGRPSSNCLIGPDAGEGANSADIVPELAPKSNELVVRGHTYDKFYGTPLDLALRSRDIRYLIVTGILTEICVNCTLLSAAGRDYRVTAVADGVATLWPNLQQACFDIWERKFARLKTTAELIEEIDSLQVKHES